MDQQQLKSRGCRRRQVGVGYGSMRRQNGDVGNPEKVLQYGKDRRRRKINANNRVKKRGKS